MSNSDIIFKFCGVNTFHIYVSDKENGIEKKTLLPKIRVRADDTVPGLVWLYLDLHTTATPTNIKSHIHTCGWPTGHHPAHRLNSVCLKP